MKIRIKIKGSKKLVHCSLCNKWKNEDDFYKTSKNKTGFSWWCKQCSRERSSSYRKENIETCRERSRLYRKNNLEKCRKNNKEYYEKNKSEFLEKCKVYHKKNKDRINKRVRVYSRKYYAENKEIIKKYGAIYRENNREKIREKHREYYKNRDKKIRNERRKKSDYYLTELAYSVLRNYIKKPPKELIKLKAQHILLLRRIKNIKQGERK
jgi:hypothetical protein